MTTVAIRRGTPLRYALAERERSYDDRGDKTRHAVAIRRREGEVCTRGRCRLGMAE